MLNYELVYDNKVMLKSSWIHCLQSAYTILRDKNKSLDDYIMYNREGDNYTEMAYYDDKGNIIRIIIRKVD